MHIIVNEGGREMETVIWGHKLHIIVNKGGREIETDIWGHTLILRRLVQVYIPIVT